ncbi:MAG: hypothetical protein WCL29_07125 [Pseudomonadota bacterium]
MGITRNDIQVIFGLVLSLSAGWVGAADNTANPRYVIQGDAV